MKKFRIIHHVDQETIDEMYRNYSPVFILSTGRSGSKFIAKLLNQSENIEAFHEPRPTLMYFSNIAFQNQAETEVLSKIFEAARMESILDIFIKNKIYAESNQCLTFFAPMIAGLFKKSKFVQLVRHPGDFVRSAIRKGWYVNDSIWESGRLKIKHSSSWQKLSQIEKLAWLWHTTNTFIDEFKNKMDPKRYISIKLEEISSPSYDPEKFLEFAGGEDILPGGFEEVGKNRVNTFRISGLEPSNIKKVENFPEYKKWDDRDKDKLIKYCQPMADLYGYSL